LSGLLWRNENLSYKNSKKIHFLVAIVSKNDYFYSREDEEQKKIEKGEMKI